MRCHIPLEELRTLQAAEPPSASGEALPSVKIRAAVLEATGGAPAHPGARPRPARARRGARAARRERGLPLGLQRDRRDDRVALPGRARARGRGRRRGGRRRGDARRRRRPCRALVDAVVRRMRANASATCRSCARPSGRRWTPAGLMDGTTAALARRRARLPLLLPLDVRRGVASCPSAPACRSRGRAVRRRGARRLRDHDRRRRRLEDGRRAPGDRVAVIGCGGVGLSA